MTTLKQELDLVDRVAQSIKAEIIQSMLPKVGDSIYIPTQWFLERGEDSNIIIHLPDSLKSLNLDFLLSLQSLHDISEYWDKSGLTEQGRIKLSLMKGAITEGKYV